MRWHYATVAVCALALLLLGCRNDKQAPRGEVWASVNGKPIYRSDVEREFRRQLAPLPAPSSEEEALSHKLRLLNDLIQQEILLHKAAQRGTLAGDSEVEAALAQLRAPYTDEEFQHQLDTQGITLAELKEELRRELSIRNLLQRELLAQIEVSDAEISSYFAAHRDDFRHPEPLYHVAHILVTPARSPDVRNLKNDDAVGEGQALRKCEQLLRLVRAGEDFGEVARNFSEDPNTALAGGDLGFFPESALEETDPALRQVVRQLEVGGVAGVVRSRDGYHLVKLLARHPAGQRELDEPDVRESIRVHLHNQKQQLLEAAYIEATREEARVVNYLARQILEAGRARP